MAETVERPANGYALSLYDDLRRDIRNCNLEIERSRQIIAAQSRSLSGARWMLVAAERTLAWMQEHQADEIAELEAARAKVREVLRKARAARGGVTREGRR